MVALGKFVKPFEIRDITVSFSFFRYGFDFFQVMLVSNPNTL